MARILAIDYGTKRVGLAVTDPMQIIATGLDTVHSKDLFTYLEEYLSKEEVECFVMGHPKQLDGSSNTVQQQIVGVKRKLEKMFGKPVHLEDERFTSKMAFDALLNSGAKKKDRHKRSGNLDRVSAVIILQSFMQKRG